MGERSRTKPTGGDICTAISGNSCKSGVPSGNPTTEEPTDLGVFYRWQGAGVNEPRPGLTVDSEGYVYVGECCSVPAIVPGVEEYPSARVQKFDGGGNFVSVLIPPEGDGSELRRPHSLAVNATGTFYARDDAFDSAARGIIEFAPSTFTAEGLPDAVASKFWGETTGFSEIPFDIDPSNQFILALESSCSSLAGSGVKIVEFHPSSEEVDCTNVTGPSLSQGKALATNTAHKLYLLVDGSPDRVVVYDMPVAAPPEVVGVPSFKEVTTSKAVLSTEIAANLGDTTVHVEYGTEPCSEAACASTAESESIGASYAPKSVSETALELEPDTDYHYRFVATNSAGSDTGPEDVFHTYAAPKFSAKCPNNLARQQTHASLLLDCRAYELVSPEEQGGYDLESNVVPGQEPFGGYPHADNRALFGMHDGGIPGVGKPTNRGVDPYVATRNAAATRWETEYVGIPADAPSTEPFSSTLAGSDPGLREFAFGGPDLCDPCFGDGSAGMPLHTAGGSLVQGMVGSEGVADPEPAGLVRKHFSADGNHFIFGSDQRFEPAGNPDNGNATIYDRNLTTGTTQVVSTSDSGATIANGDGVAALDVSANGERVLIGKLVGTDGEGNNYWDLYMHVDHSAQSVKVVETASGAQFAGMTSDGSKVFFTTPDALSGAVGGDGDNSADLFQADVGSSSATLSRVSTGISGSGDTDSCDPAGDSRNPDNWNVVPGGPTDCSVVAVGGSGGVATDTGAVYFLSPELLDGTAEEDGVDGAPNLYLARPLSGPQYVTTLESSASTPLKQTPVFDSYIEESFTQPVAGAFDGQDGSMYVYDVGSAGEFGGPGPYVQKFDASGNPINAYGENSKHSGTSGGGPEAFNGVGDTSFLSGFGLTDPVPTQIAVDNDPSSPSYRDLYVPSTTLLSGLRVRKFGSTGTYLSTISIPGELVFPAGIAVDASTGKVYVGAIELFGTNTIKVYDSASPSNAPAAPTSFPVSGQPLGIAVDGAAGKVYVAEKTKTAIYNAETGAALGTLDPNLSKGVGFDPTSGRVYVDEGNQLRVYENDVEVGTLGSGQFSESINLGANSSRLVVSNRGAGNVAVFRPETEASSAYDNPLVIDSVNDADRRHTTDFQTNASGNQAVFPTVLPLSGFDNGGRYEIFRYDAIGGKVDCLSCNPTLEVPSSDASLASDGLSITDDGRVFFNTGEGLVVRDTNGVQDVYEWNEGKVELVSTGQDRSDSGLLTVSTEGRDAFFFTRETLAANDRNGTLMKLYDARSEGGFFQIPPPPGCRASDECHGASSAPPAPLVMGSLTGTGGNVKNVRKRCGKRKVRRHGKCVRKRKRRHKRKHHHKRKHRKHQRQSTRRHG